MGLGLGLGLGLTISPTGDVLEKTEDDINEDGDANIRDEDEVVKLWDENKRPRLALHRASGGASAPAPAQDYVQGCTATSYVPWGAAFPSWRRRGAQVSDTFLPYLDGQSLSDSGSSGGEKSHDGKGGRTKRRTGMVFRDLEVKVVGEPDQVRWAVSPGMGFISVLCLTV